MMVATSLQLILSIIPLGIILSPGKFENSFLANYNHYNSYSLTFYSFCHSVDHIQHWWSCSLSWTRTDPHMCCWERRCSAMEDLPQLIVHREDIYKKKQFWGTRHWRGFYIYSGVECQLSLWVPADCGHTIAAQYHNWVSQPFTDKFIHC